MALPLPNPPGAAGGIVDAMNEINMLKRRQLENRFYAPNIESEINQRNALTKGQNITNEYLPDKLRLANAFSQMQNQFYPEVTRSEIAGRNALTNKYNTMTPLEAAELRIKNEFLPQTLKSEIDARNALSNYRGMGGIGMGTGGKEEFMFQNFVARDNPQLQNDPSKVYEAANALREGRDRLSDGTPLNPLSPASRASYDRLSKAGTYAGAAVPLMKAASAEAEIDVLNNYAQKGLEPYGTTYFGMSPSQVFDVASNDIKDQKKLGRLMASQALQYEIAQNRIRLANGQPGVTSTEELMKLSGQMMNPVMPRMTYEARKEASRYLDEALKKGLEARRKVGIGASSATSGNAGKESGGIVRWGKDKQGNPVRLS